MNKLFKMLCFIFAALFVSVGYAQVTDPLQVNGIAEVKAQEFDIYITDVSPEQLGTFTVNNYYYTIMSTSVHGASSPTFSITVKNRSDKTYVFERIVEGSEVGFDGIYGGEGITYKLQNLSYLQEVAPGQSITFSVTITASSGVNEDNVLTFFKFIEKTGEEILPGNPDPTPDPDPDPTPDPDPDPTPDPDPDPTPDPDPEPDVPTVDPEKNYFGLLEMLLSENDRCLNDKNDKDVIYNAVQKELKNPPYILHCLTSSIPGGNMANVTTLANSNLSEKMHFIFMPVKDDPNTMYLYMYYEDDATSDDEGELILTYFAVIRYFEDTKKWDEDGVYEGKAAVAYLDGGGNAGKKVWMIDPTTWTAGAPKESN